jgi:hypothetical protein
MKMDPLEEFAEQLDAQPAMPLSGQVVLLAGLCQKDDGRLRHGQTLFNALYGLRPDLADSVRGSGLDPFYQDAKVEGFLAWLREQEGARGPA